MICIGKIVLTTSLKSTQTLTKASSFYNGESGHGTRASGGPISRRLMRGVLAFQSDTLYQFDIKMDVDIGDVQDMSKTKKKKEKSRRALYIIHT